MGALFPVVPLSVERNPVTLLSSLVTPRRGVVAPAADIISFDGGIVALLRDDVPPGAGVIALTSGSVALEASTVTVIGELVPLHRLVVPHVSGVVALHGTGRLWPAVIGLIHGASAFGLVTDGSGGPVSRTAPDRGQKGPCLSAYELGEAVAVADLRTDTRFPKFSPAALAAGLAAVFTFPLRHDGGQLGALDLYRDPLVGTPGEAQVAPR